MRTLTRKQAKKEGYKIDDFSGKGPIGYRGPRFPIGIDADVVQVLSEREEKLLKALRTARNHLDWIGWGDSYERGVSMESGNMDLIQNCDEGIEGEV